MDEIDLEELLNELNEEEEGEDEEEGENEESENEPIGDLTKEELEKMIEDVIAEEFPELLKTKGEEGEEGEDMGMEMDFEEEDIELAEILAEIEGMDDDMMSDDEEDELEESWLGDTIKSIGDKFQGEMGKAEKAL